MKVLLLGSGASEGLPAIFCDCRVCRTARENGGKDIRTRTSALVDDVLKIDLGPDTLCQIHRFRLNPVMWKHVVFTHSDDDHFAVRELQYLFPPFVTGHDAKFDLGGNDEVLRRVREEIAQAEELRPFRLPLFTPVAVGPYEVTGVLATHLVDKEEALNLILDDGRARLFYATDTGWWPDETWAYLERSDRPIGLMVIDCTHGCCDCKFNGHLNIEEVIRVRERLLKAGTLTERSKVVTTHHCHRGGLTHAELETRLNPHGIEVGYDGLEIFL